MKNRDYTDYTGPAHAGGAAKDNSDRTRPGSPGVLWRLRSEPPRKLSYFVGPYSITGVLIMLLGAVAEKEIYIPSSAVIAESGTEANTHFLVHTLSPGMTLLWKLGIRP